MNFRQSKTDQQVDQTLSMDYTDYESTLPGQPSISYLHQGEMPSNLADRIRCEMERLYYHDMQYTRGKYLNIKYV